MDIKWLNKFLKNLDEEAEYIALDNPLAARNTVYKIKSTVDLLANNPSLGRPGRIHGTRELVIDKLPYIIPYRVHNNKIEILLVFHTSRKPPGSW
ncbi:MAG: type II toxin-antitoxin system RelE/ParE family toxin [Pseudomonadota bacterium]